MQVTITVTFTNTNPGDSSLTASFNGVEKTLTQSGKLSFENVPNDQAIQIDGKSLGSTSLKIDVHASPPSLDFPPGVFDGNFFII